MTDNFVFFLQSSFTQGGAFKSFYAFIKEFVLRENTQIFVYCFNPGRDVIEKLSSIPSLKIRIFKGIILGQWGRYLDAWPIGNHVTSSIKLFRDLNSLTSIASLRRQLKIDAPVVIHANSAIFRPLLTILSLIGFRDVAKICHLRERGKFGSGRFRKTLNSAIEALSSITYLAITDSIKRNVCETTKNEVFTVYNPIVMEPPGSTGVLNKDILKLLFLGGYQSNKGLLDFLRLLQQQEIALKVDFRIAGGDGPKAYRDDCLSLMDEISKEKNVNFDYLGEVSNVSAEIQNSHYVIIWHAFPHFSRCIVEAQMLQTKVITKCDPVIKEQLKISSSGIHIYDSLPSEKQLMEYLIQTKDEHVEYDSHLVDFFSVQKHVEKIENIVLEQLKR